MFSQNDYQFLLVGKSGNVTTVASAIDTLADGEIGVFTPGGTRLTTAATTSQKFVLAVGRGTGNDAWISGIVNPANVNAVETQVFAAATEQADFIGFNGVGGSVELNNSTVYRATINLNQSLVSNYGGIYVKDLVFKSDASATEAEIAEGLFSSGVFNFSKEPSVDNAGNKPVAFEMTMAAGSDVAVGTSVGPVVFTKGSTTISAADIDDGTGSAAFVVGDYIRIGATATDEVYRITAIDATANTATLSVPFQGANQSIADTALRRIVSASAGSLACGVKLTANPARYVAGKFHYEKISWKLTLAADAFGATTLTNSVVSTPGAGVGDQVSELEWFLAGNNGEQFRMGEPNIYSPIVMADEASYELIDIIFDDVSGALTKHSNKKVVTLAVPSSQPDWSDTITSNVYDVLDAILGSTINADL